MSDPLPQLTDEDVRDMTPEQLVKAREAGQLKEYLGIPVEQPFTPVDEHGKERAITEEDLAHMTAEQIVAARKAGQLQHLGYAGEGRR